MLNNIDTKKLYKRMLRIRVFEEKVLELFSNGFLSGTTHAYIGQEANAVGVITNLDSNDIIISNHRCHGHYIAFKNNPYALLCEMMGKEDGLCAGRGGSQHIFDNNFFSNGILGGTVPLAAGLAFAEKRKNSGKIICVFIGDGTLGEGIVYESLNIISKWDLPLLIVLENNQYAQSTKIENNLAGSISKRFNAFGIQVTELSTFNCIEIFTASEKIISDIRKNQKPHCLILNTYRLVSHSKSDDGRDPIEVDAWKKHDPIPIMEKLFAKNYLKDVYSNIKDEIDNAADLAINATTSKLRASD